MKKWQASMHDKFEDLPRNVRNWRDALRRASQALDDVWGTTAGEQGLPVMRRLLSPNQGSEHGFQAQKGSV
jgi:hypothetical protein